MEGHGRLGNAYMSVTVRDGDMVTTNN